MKILDRYIIKEFLRTLGIILLIFLSVFLIADLFERLDEIIENHSSIILVIRYYAFKFPFMIFSVFPFAILFATLLTIRTQILHNELVAVTSNSISLYRVFIPLVLLGILLTLLTFAVNELVLPTTNQKFNDLGYEIKGKKNPVFKSSRDSIQEVWYRGAKNRFFNMDLIIKPSKELYKVTIYHLDNKFHLKERLDAQKVFYQDGKWIFFNGVDRIFNGNSWTIKERFAQKEMPLNENFEDFLRIEKNSDALSFFELNKYLKRLKKTGLAHNQYRTYIVDLYSKISMPATCFVMMLIGISFAVKSGRIKGNVIGFIMGIALGFSYWIIFYFGISLGHGGKIPPFIASFAPAVIFGVTGIYYFFHLED